jgi:hypothetical protein
VTTQPVQRAAQPKVLGANTDAQGRLVVRIEDRPEPLVDARVARCFPWSAPESYISIRTAEGKEVTLLESLSDVAADVRQTLLRELADKVFSPQIQRVLSFKQDFGVASVSAMTDRGEVTFQIRSRDDVRVLSPTRALLRDADGNTYELPDLSKMDSTSRKHLEPYF